MVRVVVNDEAKAVRVAREVADQAVEEGVKRQCALLADRKTFGSKALARLESFSLTAVARSSAAREVATARKR